MDKAQYDNLQEGGVTSFKVPLPDWLGKDTPELREKLQSFIESLGRDQLIGELRAAYRRMGEQRDLLEEIDAELDRQSYSDAVTCADARSMRLHSMDLPRDYEHHVVITEALWDKIRSAIRKR